jgi:hypothetical protein
MKISVHMPMSGRLIACFSPVRLMVTLLGATIENVICAVHVGPTAVTVADPPDGGAVHVMVVPLDDDNVPAVADHEEFPSGDVSCTCSPTPTVVLD